MSLEKSLQESVDRLICSLKSDPSYRQTWQANLAMSFYDEMNRAFPGHGFDGLHQISNTAANNFLDLLCSVPTKRNSETKEVSTKKTYVIVDKQQLPNAVSVSDFLYNLSSQVPYSLGKGEIVSLLLEIE